MKIYRTAAFALVACVLLIGYDLRTLRNRFSKYGKIDPELGARDLWLRFVVLITDPKASHATEFSR
jgi:hypothetical protein